jgi:hypothetical protein
LAYQPTVFFSQNKPATSNQPTVLFPQNKSAPAISHQPNEQALRHGELEEDARVGVVRRRDEASEHVPFHALGFHHVFSGTSCVVVQMIIVSFV